VFFFGVILCCLRYAYWETIHDLQNGAFSVLSSSILPTIFMPGISKLETGKPCSETGVKHGILYEWTHRRGDV
jgi:hypothetical protein